MEIVVLRRKIHQLPLLNIETAPTTTNIVTNYQLSVPLKVHKNARYPAETVAFNFAFAIMLGTLFVRVRVDALLTILQMIVDFP